MRARSAGTLTDTWADDRRRRGGRIISQTGCGSAVRTGCATFDLLALGSEPGAGLLALLPLRCEQQVLDQAPPVRLHRRPRRLGIAGSEAVAAVRVRVIRGPPGAG